MVERYSTWPFKLQALFTFATIVQSPSVYRGTKGRELTQSPLPRRINQHPGRDSRKSLCNFLEKRFPNTIIKF